MKIATAADFIQPLAQKNVGAALVSGEVVVAPLATAEELAHLTQFINSPAANLLLSQLKVTHAETPVVALHPHVQAHLAGIVGFTPQQKLMIGVGAGAMTGLGVGLLIEALRTVAPRSAAAVTLGAALLGAGLGGGLGGGVITGVKFDKEGSVELKGAAG